MPGWSFLKSVVVRVEVDDPAVRMYYTIPMPSHSVSEETGGVLPSYTTVEGKGTVGKRGAQAPL